MSNNLQLYRRSVSDVLYDYALSSAYRSPYVYDPSFALYREPDIWELVRNDASFLSSIDRSSRAIVKPFRIESPKSEQNKAGKQLAAICEEAFSEIHRFNAARRRLSEARFLGRTYAYIESAVEVRSLDGTPEMPWVMPKFLRDIDRRRFRWESEGAMGTSGARSRKTHLSMFNTLSTRWEKVAPEFRSALIEYTACDTEDRVGYGRGYLEAIYFAHWMKTGTFEKIMQGVDRWANGILIGKLDSLRNASTGKTNADLLTGMKTALANMRTQHVAVMQDGDEIEVVETSGSGHEIAMNVVQYWDDVVERLCNGSTRPSGQGGQKTGARAQAETEEDTSEAFFQDEREDLDAILDSQLLGFFLNANRINFQKLGMVVGKTVKRPKFTSEQIKKEDPLVAVQVAKELQAIGFDLSKAEVSEKSGYSIPDPDEETLKGVDPVQMMEMEAKAKNMGKPPAKKE